MSTDQIDVFAATINAIKQDIEDFCRATTERIDELAETITQLTDTANNRTAVQSNPATMSLYFDSVGAVFCACDGSLIFFSGIPGSAAGCFFGVANDLNLVVETDDGPSIFMAEIRAVILNTKAHLILDSQVTLDLVNTVLHSRDSASILTIKRQSDLTAEIIDTLDRLLRKFQIVKTSKVRSHCDRAGLFHYLNARVDFAVTSCLREKYATN